MRWLARIFANAIARRVAAVLFTAALAWFGMGKAHAQSCTFESPCDQGTAYSSAASRSYAYAAEFNAANPGTTYVGMQPGQATCGGGKCYYRCVIYSQGSGGAGCLPQLDYYYSQDQTCDKVSSKTTPFLPVTGSTGCNLGCVVKYAQNADETSTVSTTGAVCTSEDLKNNCPSGSYWNGYMGVCEPVDQPCPPDQKKVNGQCVPDGKCPSGMIAVQGTTPGAIQQGSLYCKPAENECPAGNIKSPSGQCLPGEGQCAAGEVKRPNGTCGKDSNGDGVADADDPDNPNKDKEDSASGGDSCNAPPSCSGSAIACIQVKIQWRIDCNTRKNRNISGGTCGATPICTGDKCDAMEYASLLQQWKSACALEKLAKNGTGTGTPNDGSGCGAGDANCNGVADVLEGSGQASDPGDGTADVDGAKKWGIGVSAGMLDQGNIFGGGSCPQPPSFQLMGVSISGADFPYWCKAMAILRGLILVFGAFTALKILMGGVG